MKSLIGILFLAIQSQGAVAVWIDTDPSVKRGGHEVDDGFALIQAFRSPGLSIRGVSVVFGNAPLDEAFPIGQRLVRDFGPRGLPVYRGAAAAADRGKETDASRALAAALGREELTILALGPVTNIATVLERHPGLARKIQKIVAVAGKRPDQKFFARPGAKPFRDFNFEMDSGAFQVLIDSGVPLVLAPWELSSKVWMRGEQLAELRAADKSLAWVLDAAVDWLAFWKKSFGVDGFNPFDTLSVGYSLAPSEFECENLPIHIEIHSDGNPDLILDRADDAKRSALYCFQPPENFVQRLTITLANAVH
ncbi:MAG: nucleoside hydrolase [Acidobacteriota bacterium]|nr:nucleoside hydrolase [Acidobacteriota bacterium]